MKTSKKGQAIETIHSFIYVPATKAKNKAQEIQNEKVIKPDKESSPPEMA